MTAPDLPLHTERLTLRVHQPGDLPRLLEAYGDADSARYLPFGAWTEETAREHLAKRLGRVDYDGEGGLLGLVFTLRGSEEYAGDVVLFPFNSQPDTAEIGWLTHPAHVRQGYAAEAAAAMLEIAFGHYRLHRVVANLDARNTASARLCERIGMRLEAHHREDYWSKGEWCDSTIYAILASEHPSGRP